MTVRPERDEAAPYYFTYIDQVSGSDIMSVLERQLEEMLEFLAGVSEEKSLHRYSPEKWTIRQVLHHLSDTERVMLFRAFWFARGFDSPLPSYDQITCDAASRANELPWASHIDEFRAVRIASLALFRTLPAEGWMRRGIASDNPFTVRALAYLLAGHVLHHKRILQERYL